MSKLRSTGMIYQHKMLESSSENWRTIAGILGRDELRGVIVKFTGANFAALLSGDRADVAPALLERLGQVPHIAFAHETILLGEDIPWRDNSPDDPYQEHYTNFHPLTDEQRTEALGLFDRYGISVTPYLTNAELSTLATAFIEDHEQHNLLFRIYVPRGRIYAEEADTLLGLFRDWLGRAKNQRVRQDGYSTNDGHVYELFAEDDSPGAALSTALSDFSKFLDLCSSDAAAAVESLLSFGVDKRSAEEMVSRYGKQARRLQLDLRQEHRRRALDIAQTIEADLHELLEADDPAWPAIHRMVDSLVPSPASLTVALAPGPAALQPGSQPPQVVVNQTVNQQIVQTVTGNVMQGVQGTVNLGAEPRELLALVQAFGGAQTPELESSVHELEDGAARPQDRLAAKQRIKMFLIRLGPKLGDAAVEVLKNYIETKLP